MALTKEQNSEARKVYELFWESYLAGDERTFVSVYDEDVTLIGTTESEVVQTRTEVVKFFRATVDQVAGKVEVRNRDVRLVPIGDVIYINEFAELHILIDHAWTFYSKVRLTTLMRQTAGEWKICQQHSSVPDFRVQGEETIAFEQIQKENLELREAVKRRTIDLEHKNRELEIEACLERVRTRAVAMRTPSDLPGVSEQLFKELRVLGFEELRNAMINIHNDENESFINYDYSDELGQSITPLVYSIHPVIEKQIRQIRSAQDAFSETMFTGKDLEDWKEFRRSVGERDDPRIENASALYYYFYSIGTGSIGVSTFSPVGQSKLGVLKRFRNVFDFAYRRYLDVTEAEARAREAQIEASLQRVRAVALSMRKPAEMVEVCRIISEQLELLGVTHIRNTQTAILNDEKGNYLNYEYFPQYKNSSMSEIETKLHPKIEEFTDTIRQSRDAFFSRTFAGEELRDWIEYRKRTNQIPDPLLEQAESVHYYFYSIGPGALGVSTYAPLREDQLDIFKRFRNVFELAYRRFVDIELAEAQAREAQIEAALERVRARSMAMHRSDELVDSADVLFQQLRSLGIESVRTGIATFDEWKETVTVWSRWHTDGNSADRILGVVPRNAHHFFGQCFDAWKRKEKYFAMEFVGPEVEDYYRSMTAILSYPVLDRFNEREWFHTIFFDQGSLNVVRTERLTDQQISLLQRFASVFGLMYRRFLDLQTAEIQAREATIEAALERVRAKAMAMHTTSDLSETSGIVFAEMRRLGITAVRSGVVLMSEFAPEGLIFTTATSVEADTFAVTKSLDFSGHASLERQYACWKRKEDYFVTLRGDEIPEYYAHLNLQMSGPSLSVSEEPTEEHGYYFHFPEGQFYVWTRQRYSDAELAVLGRFKAIVELTFRRYLDLQRAESQTREAQIEACLERVRSRTLAMQRSDELAETAAVLFQQLISLGIEPNRLYIAIVKDDHGHAEFWITDEDGSKVSSAFSTDLNANPTFSKMLAGWRDSRVSQIIDMQGEELQEYFRQLGELNVPFKGGLSQKRRVQTIAYFSQGYIGMASPDSQPAETITLLERFAAVFNLTFTRFNDLQLAEAQTEQARLDLIQLQAEKKRAEIALQDLRATQEQLLQQEKLASLGQLTAGIAHEIKNPLNFVNNFSSVSVELLDEVVMEITSANPEMLTGEAQQLLADIRTNLTKIVEHGTRADGIVRSMLQHSRGGSGRREATDLNALVREYVNLAFHGMRASKNPINVDISLELHETMGTVSIIAEDFSRVIINLCQNAFDAMREKSTSPEGRADSYLPKLTVRTRREASGIFVEVADNGPGIPEGIKDKILQPFFTTKKGTQGTGLGLSITHDIIKAHGGEMSIHSNQDKGATFVIALPT